MKTTGKPVTQTPILPAQEEIERGSMDPEAAIKLLETWAADESGYDEKAWPELRENIEKFRLSARKKFRETRETD